MRVGRRSLLGLVAALPACSLEKTGASLATSDSGRLDLAAKLKALEAESGGRLGAAIVDREGKLLLGNRIDERFAFCSTFKAPLAAMVHSRAAKGEFALSDMMPISEDDLVGHGPAVRKALAEGRKSMSIEELAQGAVIDSDNAAANILLRKMGGPEGFTAWLRTLGDDKTRLDRYEWELNQNALGDPRDTSTPLAYANLYRLLDRSPQLPVDTRFAVRELLYANRTGDKRIRAGVPEGWSVGDKTGTGDADRRTINDAGFVVTPDHRAYYLAIFMDDPDVNGWQEGEAFVALAARILIEATGKHSSV